MSNRDKIGLVIMAVIAFGVYRWWTKPAPPPPLTPALERELKQANDLQMWEYQKYRREHPPANPNR